MAYFLILQSVLFIIIVFLLILLSMFWPPDSPWAPWWRTKKQTARAICKLAKVGKEDVVYDLGCGTGTALIIAGKEFGAKGVGIEIDPLRFVVSTLMIRINRAANRITIKRKNFFDVDISNATVIFVYLVPKALRRLLPKFKRELRSGTRIVSYRYKINLPFEKYDKENEIRLYVL